MLWPGVQFRTGQAFDIARIVRAAQRAGCVVGLDLAHSIGNMPLALHDERCGLRRVVQLQVSERRAGRDRRLLRARASRGHAAPAARGLVGARAATRFEMKPGFRAAAGAAGWQVSNPPVLAAAPLIARSRLFQEAGMARLREKSVALTGLSANSWSTAWARTCSSSRRASRLRAAASFRCAFAGAGRGKRVFDWLGAHGVVVRLARAGHHPRRARAALQQRSKTCFVSASGSRRRCGKP